MGWVHLFFGLALFVVFAITGSYMRADFPDKDLITPELRLLMRSRHIYILFSALMHILLGIYFRPDPRGLLRTIQYLGSAVLIVASVVLVWAFVAETYAYAAFSDLSRNGIYLSLGGVAIHFIACVVQRSAPE